MVTPTAFGSCFLQPDPVRLFCDNLAAIHIAANPVKELNILSLIVMLFKIRLCLPLMLILMISSPICLPRHLVVKSLNVYFSR